MIPVAVLAVAAAVSIGCSSSDDESSDPTTTTEATTTTTASGTLERYEGATSEVYADLANWVCHPDAEDVCDDGLDATVVDADGTLTEQPWGPDPDAAIDCFYVYPTISADTSEISDRVPGDEERFVTLNQAARLGETCRVFAPVYRQRTLAGLTAALGAGTTTTSTTVAGQEPETSPGYTDVRDAFRHYMATENDGRGVVLIGHSQGASVLNQLMQDEVDPNEDVRDQLVAAYLAGSTVRVPEGEDVGGDFEELALCREDTQTGCVVSWASFRSDEPPDEGALFGRPRSGDGVAACNSPASLAGGAAETQPYFPASPSSSILSSPGTSDDGSTEWVEGGSEIETPFVTTPGLALVECVSRGGFDYLEVTVQGDPDTPRVDDIGGDLGAAWGLHLQDVNLVMGDIVELVGTQGDAWAAERGSDQRG
jgi:hypothetical protein